MNESGDDCIAIKSGRNNDGRRVNVPGEGKSTLALNLAAHAARAGLRTLLIGADLRRGQLQQKLGLAPGGLGLADLIGGQCADWADVIRTFSQSRLSFVSRGTDSHNTVDLLYRWLNEHTFTKLKQEFDLIVVDAAPLMPVSDSIRFLSLVDEVLCSRA